VDFALSDDERQIQELAKGLAARYFAPEALRWQRGDGVPRENISRLVDAGLLGMTASPLLGGGGRPFTEAALAIEAVGQVCPVTANYLHLATTGPAVFLAMLGSDEQRQRFLPAIIGGQQIMSVSITEPDVGSAASDLRTRARVEGDAVVVDGSKMFCGGADVADVFVVFVRFGPGTRGIGALIVDRDTPGFTVGPNEGDRYGHEHHIRREGRKIPSGDRHRSARQCGPMRENYGQLGRCSRAAS